MKSATDIYIPRYCKINVKIVYKSDITQTKKTLKMALTLPTTKT